MLVCRWCKATQEIEDQLTIDEAVKEYRWQYFKNYKNYTTGEPDPFTTCCFGCALQYDDKNRKEAGLP